MKGRYVIEKEETLNTYLISIFGNKEAKSIFKKYAVVLNNHYITDKQIVLKKDDVLSFFRKIEDNIYIVYEDKDILVVTKPYNLLTVSDLKRTNNTLYFKVSNYYKTKNKKNRIFIVHRLDFETSGLVIFAKSEKVKEKLQENWDTLMMKRGYQAVVHGSLKDDTLKFHLKENRAQKVYVATKDSYTKEAITNYYVVKTNGKYSLLDIEIKTGRKHQIRVSFKEINHPIVGDKKYGISDSKHQMYLIANELIFMHPTKKDKIELLIPTPTSFYKLIS